MILKAVNRTTTIPKSNLCYPWPQAPQGVPSSTLLESAIFFHLTFYCGTCKAINACHHISCFLKTSEWHFTFKTWKSNQSFFARRFFAELRGQLHQFFCGKLTNLPLAFETVHSMQIRNLFDILTFYNIIWIIMLYVRQFSENTQKSSISLKIRKKNSKLFFVKRLAVVSVFLRSGTILKNDHFHCIWSVISLCSTPRAFFPENDDAKCQFGDIFYLFIFFMICCALSSEGNSASTHSFGTFLKAFVSLLLFATSISFFLFLTFKTIRRSSLVHCALL